MAGIDTGGHGAKRSVNQEIPLVPFIDFLLCCVMFLLVTAVWNQLARIDTNPATTGRAETTSEPPIPRRLRVTPTGYQLAIGSDAPETIPKSGESYDRVALATQLGALQGSDRTRHDLIVEASDGVPYEEVVRALDATAGAGLVDFSLSPIATGP